MTTIYTAHCLEQHCVWGEESESYEAVYAAAKGHEEHHDHETVLHSRYKRSPTAVRGAQPQPCSKR